jgi:radical SAM protein with 4Fe4S-binding SPASM domain
MTASSPAPTYTLTGCNWELTLKCTLNCFHCGSSAGRVRPNELSLDECFSVADQLIALGCKDLTMIGGEVFLFKGWDRLAAYLSDKGLAINIVTNGYNIGADEIEQIKRARLVNVGISIDGMQANHNHIRGRSDAFQRLTNSLDLLDAAGIPVCAVTSLMKFNCQDLEDLYSFLLEHHVRGWQIQLVNAMGNLAGKDEITVSLDQVRAVIKFIREKNRSRRMVVVAADSIGYFDENETHIRGITSPICYWGSCSAGISSVFIDSVGNVKGCGSLYSNVFIEDNLRNRSLADIWNSSNAFAYNRQFSIDLLSGRCKDCAVGSMCRGGCRSSNYFSTQDLYSSAFCCRPSKGKKR